MLVWMGPRNCENPVEHGLHEDESVKLNMREMLGISRQQSKAMRPITLRTTAPFAILPKTFRMS